MSDNLPLPTPASRSELAQSAVFGLDWPEYWADELRSQVDRLPEAPLLLIALSGRLVEHRDALISALAELDALSGSHLHFVVVGLKATAGQAIAAFDDVSTVECLRYVQAASGLKRLPLGLMCVMSLERESDGAVRFDQVRGWTLESDRPTAAALMSALWATASGAQSDADSGVETRAEHVADFLQQELRRASMPTVTQIMRALLRRIGASDDLLPG